METEATPNLTPGGQAFFNNERVDVLQVDAQSKKVLIRRSDGNTLGVYKSQLRATEKVERIQPVVSAVQPAEEPASYQQLKDSCASWNPRNFTAIGPILKQAVTLGVVTEPLISREMGVSTSTAMNWANGNLFPPTNVQEELITMIRNGLAMGARQRTVEQQSRPSPKAGPAPRLNPDAVADLDVSTDRQVQVIEVAGETASLELWQEGEEWKGEIPSKNLSAHGDHKLDVVLDLKASLLHAIEESRKSEEPDEPEVQDGDPEAEPADE